MSGEYFDKLPEITYNGVLIRDITRRINFLKQTINNPYVVLPYTIKEGEKAEDIAYYYYGNANYDWLVYLANDMIDPYNDWPMDDFTFDQYIISKYRERAESRNGWDVVAWAQDETRDDNIVYYYKEIEDGSDIISGSIPTQPQTPPPPQQQSDFDGEVVFINGVRYTLVKE
jgi:hypothetical protein